MPHMSGRMRREMIDAVMEGLGGVERIRAWAEKDDDNFKEFFKVWARGEARAQASDAAPDVNGVEALLARLDAGESARVITPTSPHKDAHDAPDATDAVVLDV